MPTGTRAEATEASRGDEKRMAGGLAAAGGLTGALAMSGCCVLPLVLFSLGASGAWIGNLSALAPYQPIFAAGAIGPIGYGFYLVYGKPRACTGGEACARPLPGPLVKATLWVAAALVAVALVFPYIAPSLLGI